MPSEDQPVINCRIRSPANPELLDDRPVPLGVLLAQVLDQTPPLADQHQQTASRMVVLGVLLEVLGQAVDPLGEERDLHLGRPRVSIVDAILLNEGFLLFDGQRHEASNRHAQGSPGSTGTGSKRLVLLLITERWYNRHPAK